MSRRPRPRRGCARSAGPLHRRLPCACASSRLLPRQTRSAAPTSTAALPSKRDRKAMAVRLNHTIIVAHDRDASALFLTEMLGLPAPAVLGPFAVVQLGDTSLDFMAAKEYGGSGDIASQHYAFLVSEGEFDEIFARICARQLPYWADPGRRQQGAI